MFVKNKERIDFQYRKGSYLAVLKAMTVSYVDENKVSAEELLACYGQRIDIISRDLVAQRVQHTEEKKEIKRGTPRTVETIKREDLNDEFIEKILEEIGETSSIPEKKEQRKVLNVVEATKEELNNAFIEKVLDEVKAEVQEAESNKNNTSKKEETKSTNNVVEEIKGEDVQEFLDIIMAKGEQEATSVKKVEKEKEEVNIPVNIPVNEEPEDTTKTKRKRRTSTGTKKTTKVKTSKSSGRSRKKA